MKNAAIREFARLARRVLSSSREIVIATHIDTDGLCSGAILHLFVKRLGKDARILHLPQFDPRVVRSEVDFDTTLVLTDFGSGGVDDSILEYARLLIVDHHAPNRDACLWNDDGDRVAAELNAHFIGYDGSTECSSSALCAAVFFEAFRDPNIIPLGLLGAVGDMQYRPAFRGLNRELFSFARQHGLMDKHKDILFFGRQTRDLIAMLQYGSPAFIPGMSRDWWGCKRILRMALGDDTAFLRRKWFSLSDDEKSALTEAIVVHVTERATNLRVGDIIGDVYENLTAKKGTVFRDLMELSTLCNSCGRNEAFDIAHSFLTEDERYEESVVEAMKLLLEHKKRLKHGLRYIEGLSPGELKHLTYYDVGDVINPRIVGSVCGMALKTEYVDDEKPLMMIANEEDGSCKISTRTTPDVIRRGINLSVALRVAEEFGGYGGGHDGAAGATVPREKLDEFITRLDEVLGQMLNGEYVHS